MSFAKLLCVAYITLFWNTIKYLIALHHVHVLSLNLNFENPVRIIENYTRGGGGVKKILDGNIGGSILKMSKVWGVILLKGRNPEKFSSPPSDK